MCTLHGTPEVMGKRGCRGRRRSHENCWIAIRLNCFVQLDARASRAEPAALARPGGRLPGLRGASLIFFFFSLPFFPLSFIFLFLPFSLPFIYSYSFLSFFFFFVYLSSFLFLFFLPFFFYSFFLSFFLFFQSFLFSLFRLFILSLSFFLSIYLSFPSFFLSVFRSKFFPFKMSLFRRILEGLTLKFIS